MHENHKPSVSGARVWRRLAAYSAAAIVATGWLACGRVVAQELLSRPDIPGYATPEVVYPSPRPEWLEYVHVAGLAAMLALASYFALVRRWRAGLFGLAVVSLAWLGFWRRGCVCPIGSIQNVTAGLANAAFPVPWTVVLIFALPIAFALVVGRVFCAAVCPLGAVQELVAIRPVKVPAWLEHTLGLGRYVYLGLAVMYAATGTAFIVCEYDPFVGFFRLSSSLNMFVLGMSFVVVGFFVGRPYCRYVCPYGAILGLCSRLAAWHVRIPPGQCIKCRLCENACPYNAIAEPTVPPTGRERVWGRRRLAALLLLVPAWIAAGAILGRGLGPVFSRLHPTVRLAEDVRLTELGLASWLLAGENTSGVQLTGPLKDRNEAVAAFRKTGRPPAELYAEAQGLQTEFRVAGAWLGAWVGLVMGVKLVTLAVRRHRSEYVADRAACVSCGRCFWYCPEEQIRLGLYDGRPAEEGPAVARPDAASA